MSSDSVTEIARGERFGFGENWSRFLGSIDSVRIEAASNSMVNMLGRADLNNKTFLDVGSGSGLLSLVASQMNANVTSFDFDPKSVECTRALKKRFSNDVANWKIEQGSILDQDYLKSLGKYDIVYSWGVLHHTGDMKTAFENINTLVHEGGTLYLAIYNDQGLISKYWSLVKRFYNKNVIAKAIILFVHTPYLFLSRWLYRFFTGRLRMDDDRGMTLWYDMFDWLGGYPFEVAKPEEVFEHFQGLGYQLQKFKTCAGKMGCNEFVFTKQ